MTTLTPTRRPPFRATFLSEWTKLTSLRSTAYTLVTVVALAAGFGALIGNGSATRYHESTPEEQAAFDPTAVSLQSYIVVQLVVSVLGVLIVTSEYATGMIRTSLASVPSRPRLLAAKAAVGGTVALLVGQVAAFGSFFVAQALLASNGAPSVTLGSPDTLRAVVGAGLYLALICLLGVAVGVLVRATAGSVVLMVAVTLLIPVLVPTLPEDVAKFVGTYWPTQAGARIVTVVPNPNILSPWVGFSVLAGTVAVMLGIAFVVFQRRDA